MRPARDSGLNPLLAVLLCAAAGAAFAWLHLPLPWMIGPLLAMAACNFAGAQLRAPHVTRVLVLIVGTVPGYRALRAFRTRPRTG